jgi:hypothetical protein
MSYDPSGPGLPPEPPIEEPDDSRSNWRRGAGTAGASLGDLVAALRQPSGHRFERFGFTSTKCNICGRPHSERDKEKR